MAENATDVSEAPAAVREPLESPLLESPLVPSAPRPVRVIGHIVSTVVQPIGNGIKALADMPEAAYDFGKGIFSDDRLQQTQAALRLVNNGFDIAHGMASATPIGAVKNIAVDAGEQAVQKLPEDIRTTADMVLPAFKALVDPTKMNRFAALVSGYAEAKKLLQEYTTEPLHVDTGTPVAPKSAENVLPPELNAPTPN